MLIHGHKDARQIKRQNSACYLTQLDLIPHQLVSSRRRIYRQPMHSHSPNAAPFLFWAHAGRGRKGDRQAREKKQRRASNAVSTPEQRPKA